ncbi:hypothetical protein ACFY4B_27115 [Kitasatospora sp. NPDC001261]|uniref:hypothetical protein n=1 Tax=Kitasatospora sp. NPDC001261 TaxID=3364012 RepID=UPI0036A6B610
MTDRRPSRKRSREIRAAGGKYTKAMRANDARPDHGDVPDPDSTPLGPVGRWRGAGGPEQWQRAWSRAIGELAPVRAAQPADPYDPYQARWTEGAAGLALVYYLLATTRGESVEAVSTDEVRSIAELPDDTRSAWPAVARIDELFARAGHLLDAPEDPVAACWSELRADCSPTGEWAQNDWVQSDWTFRWGADRVVSLSVVLHRLAVAGSTP